MIEDIAEGNVSEEKWNYYLESEREAGVEVKGWPSFINLKDSVVSGFIPKAPDFEKVKLVTNLQKKLVYFFGRSQMEYAEGWGSVERLYLFNEPISLVNTGKGFSSLGAHQMSKK